MISEKKTHVQLKILFFTLFFFIVLTISVGADYQTNLQSGMVIKDVYESDLDAGAWSVPVVFDWNI
jgi:hypothetical protein